MKWQNKLNKHDKTHLREQGMRTLQDIAAMRNDQRKLTGGKDEACMDCKSIAIKLGIES